jgi:hypothetical protein
MNGQLTGKRTITSAYRTMGLGSPSSDHVMGRAYDLTGQNLGAYSKLVHANGGFAEFHGAGGGRHLHVVPGPGPIGDTRTPASSYMAPQRPSEMGGGGGVTVNMNVYPGSNMNTKEFASMVITQLKAEMKNAEQRS